MYCKECGKLIDSDSKFCSYCGTKQTVVKQEDSNHHSLITDPDQQKHENSVLIEKPSPRETEKSKSASQTEKFDKHYTGDNGAMFAGVIAVLINLILLFSVSFENPYDQQIFTVFASIINTIWRIIATIWAINIAKRQNRKYIAWGFFAFFIPNLALIIIGSLKRLYIPDTEQKNEAQIESISVEDFNSNEFKPSTYKEKIIKKHSFWKGNQDEFIIEFSNGKTGKVYSLGIDCFYFIADSERIYYRSKEETIFSLDYYLVTNKINDRNRLTGNFTYYPS